MKLNDIFKQNIDKYNNSLYLDVCLQKISSDIHGKLIKNKISIEYKELEECWIDFKQNFNSKISITYLIFKIDFLANVWNLHNYKEFDWLKNAPVSVQGELANYRYTRTLQDMPQNIATPEGVVKMVEKDFADKENINLTTLKFDDLSKKGFLLTEAMDSKKTSRILIIELNKDAKGSKPIVLVGKGITYDSGGYNIKIGKNLLGMKADMSGGAVVIGIMKQLAETNADEKVVAIIPLCENVIDANAMTPQMTFKAQDGTWVEIKNTDAEGRLVLADSVIYANQFDPEKIITIATLTGSVTIPLSNHATAIMSNTNGIEEIAQTLESKTGERLAVYRRFAEVIERLKSSSVVANIANTDLEAKCATQYAFEFINYFAKENELIHFDIGGTGVYNRARGTAPMFLSIIELIKNK